MICFMIAAAAGFVAGALTACGALLLLASAWASSATRPLNGKPGGALPSDVTWEEKRRPPFTDDAQTEMSKAAIPTETIARSRNMTA